MEAFEKELLDMMPNIKFRSVKDTFQKKLEEDIPKTKYLSNVFFPHKTNIIYEMAEQHHKIPLPDNITKTYKKAPPNLETSINLEAKNIAELINPDDHILCIA